MKAIPVPVESSIEPLERFSVAVVYEDSITHGRARELCDELLNRCWGYMEFDFTWWSFESLKDPSMAHDASGAAATASLVVLAAHARPELPPVLRDWMDQWRFQRRPQSGTLAALIGTPGERKTAPATDYLRRMAQEAGMDFLPRLTPAVVPPEEWADFTDKKAQIHAALGKLLDPHHPPSHWGINE